MNRITWIDNLRGLSILAVIFLHCTIAVNNNAGHFTLMSSLVNEALAPIRLGLMFFVSGLFVEAGLSKGRRVFIENKVKSILYPFAIWVIIYAGLKIVFSSMSNTPQSPANILLMHLTGGGDITWFLHSLFLFFIVILAVRRLPFYLVFFSCMIASATLPAIPDNTLFSSFDNHHINKSLYLFVFFYLGDLLVRMKVDIPQLVNKTGVLMVSLLSFVLLFCLNMMMTQHLPQPLLSPLALLSIPLFIWIALHLKMSMAYYVGVNSIVFFLSHYLAIQFFAKLVKFGGTSLWVNDVKFLLAFVFALSLPWALCLLRERGMFNFLFTLKKPRKTPATQPLG
ncbi:acyltransferase family protein [[Erwinia] mediterraneensis]|uniref:acyltransferase family protein n=1 Tax=[Erwinia] mediterraneensis TaxID=2161819 RepID=UPI0010307EFC|nr:acyltransferase [[Erwinia] mediterraneensis]